MNTEIQPGHDHAVLSGVSPAELDTLLMLLSQLPAQLPAPLVLTVPGHRIAELQERLVQSSLPVVLVQHCSQLQAGSVYIVPSDTAVIARLPMSMLHALSAIGPPSTGLWCRAVQAQAQARGFSRGWLTQEIKQLRRLADELLDAGRLGIGAATTGWPVAALAGLRLLRRQTLGHLAQLHRREIGA